MKGHRYFSSVIVFIPGLFRFGHNQGYIIFTNKSIGFAYCERKLYQSFITHYVFMQSFSQEKRIQSV